MTVGFSTEIDNRPTHFVEKIQKGLQEYIGEANIWPYQLDYIKRFNKSMIEVVGDPKIHTIREDKNDLWQPGKDMHLVIHNKTPKRYQFAPTLKCRSIQRIQIIHSDQMGPVVIVDKRVLLDYQVVRLAKNDGFDSVKDFYSYFNKNFTGKLIHWTNYKY